MLLVQNTQFPTDLSDFQPTLREVHDDTAKIVDFLLLKTD